MKRIMANSGLAFLVFSLLVTCSGETSWNQDGRVKSQVHLLLHDTVMRYAVYQRDMFTHASTSYLKWDPSYFSFSPKQTLRRRFEFKQFKKIIMREWESDMGKKVIQLGMC